MWITLLLSPPGCFIYHCLYFMQLSYTIVLYNYHFVRDMHSRCAAQFFRCKLFEINYLLKLSYIYVIILIKTDYK